jgi:tripartite-type tricarboxylate transporter receptor subunit TctC
MTVGVRPTRFAACLRTTSLLACGLALGFSSSAGAQDPIAEFYKGKQVTITVGFGSGGSASLYAQVLGRHMGRYLPGNPGFVVQHMPGAGGLVVTNHNANTAARDGTAFTITDRAVPLEPLLGNPNAKFDARRFGWIGNANVEYTTCIAWHTARVKTLQDAMTHELVAGGTGAEATAVIFPKAVNKLLGTRIKIVLGYPGSTEILLAMERGEIESFCAIGWTFVKLRKGDWLKEKKINILFQMALAKHPEIPDVPFIPDLARTPEDRQVFEFLFTPQQFGRAFFAPQDVPPARLQALRGAFERTLKDRAFLEDADKMGLEVQLVGGEETQAQIERVYATPKAVIERARSISQ